jgi:hypothetical protein
MMTKKHYKTIAKILRDHLLGQPIGLNNIGHDLAGFFKSDNPNFDKNKFLKAMGLEETTHTLKTTLVSEEDNFAKVEAKGIKLLNSQFDD